jgi:AcrR family transcriptional regulator
MRQKIRYTKMVIRQALLDLMKTNPVNKITVTEICELADINRGTFYAYYTDPYDLMAQIENVLFLEVNNVLQKSIQSDTPSDMLVEILEYISKNIDLCKVLLSPNGDKEFVRRLVNIAHDKNIAEWHSFKPEMSIETLELLYIFISNGTVGTVESWIINDPRQSPKEVAEFITALIERCLHLGADVGWKFKGYAGN